jgi:hypothetical protein
MAHRCRPSSTLTWKRLRRSYCDGAVWPSRRCCSTEAGSVSAWVTMRRRSMLRNSPGTSFHTGWPIEVAEAVDPALLLGSRKMPQR